jgi:hypothetical protein
MSGLPTALALTLMLSGIVSLDLPVVSPGDKPAVGSASTLEQLAAARQRVPAAKIPLGKDGLDLRVFPEQEAVPRAARRLAPLLNLRAFAPGAGAELPRSSSGLPKSACNARAFSWKNAIFSWGDESLSCSKCASRMLRTISAALIFSSFTI